MKTAPTVVLNNGLAMPMLGLGVYMTSGDQANAAAEEAIAAGYRLIDTAAAYGNEVGVGSAVRSSGVSRAELFITTKLWIADYGYDEALRAVDQSLHNLKLDHIDLMLLHWPAPSGFDRTIAAYRALERMHEQGAIKATGVSNFTEAQLDHLDDAVGITPAVNQVELHPYFSQTSLVKANQRRGILTQAWSPIGGIYINHPADPNQVTEVLNDPGLVEIATHHARSPAQVVLRWHFQSGVATIPKSVNPERIRQNIDIFDFELSQKDMEAIGLLNRDARAGAHPDVFDLDFLTKLLQK